MDNIQRTLGAFGSRTQVIVADQGGPVTTQQIVDDLNRVKR